MEAFTSSFNLSTSDVTPGYDVTTGYDVTSGYDVTTVDPRRHSIYTAYNVIVALNSGLITLALGCGVKIQDLFTHLKRPLGPLIGVVCQSILVPLICYLYARAMNFNSYIAVGILVIGSCPGGALSNIFTYWSRGELSLSIAMTAFSTTLAIGTLPLNMFLYTRSWLDNAAAIPYVNMVITIAATWVSVTTGALLGWKVPRIASKVAKIGSTLGFLLIFVVGALQRVLYPGVFDLPWEGWLAGLTLPLIGCTLGFLVASAFCLPLSWKRAIAYETGTQNVSVALTLIAFSFPEREAALYTQLPLLYAAGQLATGLTSSLIHQLYYRTREGTLPCHWASRRRAASRLSAADADKHQASVAGDDVTTDISDDSDVTRRLMSTCERV